MDLGFYFKLFLRRLHYFLVFLVLGTAGGLTAAKMLPAVYSSQSVLVVESEQIPGELAASTVRTEATEALQIIRQRILTRAGLLELANDFQIYGPPGSAERRSMTPDQVVTDLRRRINIRTTGGTSRRGAREATLVTVAFNAPDPQLSADVVNEIVTQILQRNVELRRGVAGQTLEFFSAEVERLDRELSRQEGILLAFKEEHLEALPDSLEFRRGQQLALQTRLQQLTREESVLRDRRDRLVTLYETSGEFVGGQDQPMTPNEAELLALRKQLSLARSVLSQEHPRLRMLEARAEAMADIVAEEQGATLGTEDGEDPQLTALEIQLADIDGQLEFMGNEREQINTQLSNLQATISATPGNTVRLEAMERDYAALRTQYDEAVRNRATAETGDVIENLSKGQRITVIEAAVAPSEPTSPNRPLIAIAGVAGGAALGLAFVVLLELMNSSIRRPVDLQNKLGITPFGTLPLIRTPGQIRRRRAIILLTLLTVAVAVPAGLWYVQTEVMPLDLIFQRILDKVGIAGLTGSLSSNLTT
ncbi:lipopolysaccharide biosynthesis protein [Tropicimonas sp. TH_r6]|uniref:GumC family protein n=1 Tax=Tropicimonas sp. TH_r6 TaxID=3082085 RepID=UPI00295475AF|nr:lipopolysaccharide biosynthesis protein [Tropicimonas sp. TH_r6]MDV7145530.1 lipopolysaccharide biosynthesis protein [Tropicimonas sp. TH_r6]